MSSKSKEVPLEQKEMLNVCWGEKSNKAAMELISYIFSTVKVSNGPKQTQNNIITVFVNQPAAKVNTSSVTSGQLLMNCLVYCLLKYRNLKVDFCPVSFEVSKIKKKKIALLEVSNDACFRINQTFSNNIAKFLESQNKSPGIPSFNIQEIDLKCSNSGSSSIDSKLKKHILSFIQYFYINIYHISSNNNFYIGKNNLELFCVDNHVERGQIQEISESQSSNKIEENQQKILRDKIYKQLGLFYIDSLIIKDDSCDIREILLAEQSVAQNDLINSQQDMKSNSIRQINFGYFGRFYGNNFQYLSKMYLSFSENINIEAIADVLKVLPNLSSMRLRKRGNQITVPNINFLIQVLIKYNTLIEQFWLKNIKVQVITFEMLQILYEECPYLIELELHKPPQEDQEKKSLLNAFRLRKISLSNSLQMSKLLINHNYNFNSIIQIIDCIEPICF